LAKAGGVGGCPVLAHFARAGLSLLELKFATKPPSMIRHLHQGENSP
jgi:hypothetical protein